MAPYLVDKTIDVASRRKPYDLEAVRVCLDNRKGAASD
jgi:hypothetical protein